MIRFDVLIPGTLEEAFSLLGKYGKEAIIMAGGTDLVPRLKHRTINYKYLVNIKKIQGMDGISYSRESGVSIGALTKIRALEKSPVIRDHFRPLWEAAGQIGSVQVRNIATLGGNLCNAAPSAETAAPLLALEARALVAGPEGERTVPLNDFFLGPGKTVLKQAEILKEIHIPPLPPRTGGTYFKLSTRKAMDIAMVGVASVLTLKDGMCQNCQIGLGAVAPTPVRAIKAEQLLQGHKLEPDLLEKAGLEAMKECQPISDHRASASYRREMVRELTIKTLQRAAQLIQY